MTTELTGERSQLAALPLDDKVRLLTGADSWRIPGCDALGLRPMVTSDGPSGVRGIDPGRKQPLQLPALPVRARRHLGSRARPRARRGPRRRGAEQGRGHPPGPDDQPHAHPAGRAGLRVLLRGPGADRPDRGRLRDRRPVGRGRDHGEALRRQRLGDRAVDLRRTHRRAGTARAVPGPVRGLRPGSRHRRGHGRLQPGQRQPDDRARPAARRGAQARVGFHRPGHLRLGRHPQHGADRGRRARPGHARAQPVLGPGPGRGGPGRAGARAHDRRQGGQGAPGRPPGRRPRRAGRQRHGCRRAPPLHRRAPGVSAGPGGDPPEPPAAGRCSSPRPCCAGPWPPRSCCCTTTARRFRSTRPGFAASP